MKLPKEFAGTLYHSVRDVTIVESILQNGWKPEKITNTMYGTAIYLAHTNWYNDSAAPTILACKLELAPNEVMVEFSSSALGTGMSSRHLREYWRDNGVPCFKTTQRGTDLANIARKEHFISQGIRAIAFDEYEGVTVIAVYDTSCIVSIKRVKREDVPRCPVNPL